MIPDNVASVLKGLLGEFLNRDHVADVARINGLVAGLSNGLSASPLPVLFTGDPFCLPVGKCVAVLGINPALQDEARAKGAQTPGSREYAEMRRIEEILRSGHIEQAIDEYLALRASYFAENSQIYYGPYFTRLANKLQRWFPTSAGARSFFREHVFKADMIPYFSKNVDGIKKKEIVALRDDALRSYHEILLMFLTALQPCWIHCNGLMTGEIFQAAFEGDFESKDVFDEKGKKYVVRFGRIDLGANSHIRPVPVIVHGFLTSPSGPQSKNAFNVVAREWDKWRAT